MSSDFIDKRLIKAVEWAAQLKAQRGMTTPTIPWRIIYMSRSHGICDRTMRVYDTILKLKHAYSIGRKIHPGVVVSYN